MTRITNITRTVLEKRLGLTSKQDDVLTNLRDALENVFNHGMGARELAVALQDFGPALPGQIN
jgi:hypothetical protein